MKILDFLAVLWYNLTMETMNVTTTSNAETETVSRAEYDALLAENKELSRNLKYVMEQMNLLKKKVFGASSEKASVLDLDQMSLFFNELEAISAMPAQENTPVAAHTRKKKATTLEEILPEGIPEEVIEHSLSEKERECPVCGEEMQVIGKEEQLKLRLIPAHAVMERHIYFTYACMNCKVNETETPILNTPKEPSVIPGSFATPEAIAHIMTQKFVIFSPLYRQEQEWNRAGVMLSRQTMSNWLLRAAEDYLTPIYAELHQQLLQHQVLHADETTLQVLREDGKTAQTKSYMWMYRTSGDAEHPIVLYEYQPNRKADHAKAFLKGFKGYLHADGYAGYHKLQEEISVVGCMAHARRKFDEALNAIPQKDRPDSAALAGIGFFTALYAVEEELAGLTPEERHEQRLKREKPILDALQAWAQTKSVAPKSALGRALYYLEEQWPYLIRYLEDGRLEIDNNRAERSIKPFVMGRKNFLFANTPGGAKGSATIYSLVETALENGLDPFRYLTYIFSTAPKLKGKDPDWAKKLTPGQVPESCRSLQTNK